MAGRLARVRAIIGLAGVHLVRSPGRTTLAVLAIALAVLGTTLLASVGFGVLDTGTERFDQTGRDLWITGGPLQFTVEGGTAIKNSVTDSHQVAASIEREYADSVNSATPMAFHAVYVGRNESDLRLLTGVGVPKAEGSLQLEQGQGFGFYDGDVHYANGTYNGTMTNEVIIDPRTAELFDVSINESLLVGGSRGAAKDNRFTVVGISPTFSKFLGTPAVATRLSELQEITGTTGADRATFIVIRLHDDAETSAIKAALEQDYPEYDVRTNRQQLETILQQNLVIIAAAAILVVLAIVSGLTLTANLLSLIVYQQRAELAALHAIGISTPTIIGLVGGQGLILGVLGGGLGLLGTPISVMVLNDLAATLVGFESLLRTPGIVYLTGACVAIGIGAISAAVAGWTIVRGSPLSALSAY